MSTAVVNGAEIYYKESGSGPPIILSPGGLQGVLASYEPVRQELSHEHRVISYDRRFGGQSNSPLVVQTWDMACQDVIDLMDVLDIEQAYLGEDHSGRPSPWGVPTVTLIGCERYFHPTSPAASSVKLTWR
jgi:pimeloyl-ACP methyl ester carboxylesterase